MPNQLTPEQQAVLNAAADTDSHIILNAKAGSGKTFTLKQLIPLLRGNTMLQAFNKSIAQELSLGLGHLDFAIRANLEITTCHAFGLATYRRGSNKGRSLRIDKNKTSYIFKDRILKGATDADFKRLSSVGYTLRQLVSHAKNSGFGISGLALGDQWPDIEDATHWESILQHHSIDIELEKKGFPIPEAIEICQTILRLSNAMLNMIDFDDMIYLPLLYNYQMMQFDNVLIDEAQDLSSTRREFAFRSLKPSGRIIAVGDPNQAIYGFTGADSSSLSNIARQASDLGPVTHLPLSICFRCDQTIIREAQKLVPDIKFRDGAGEGSIERITLKDDFSLLADRAEPGEAILCRLNRPNVAAALSLLKLGKRCKIEGKDIGAKLLRHAKQACKDMSTPLADATYMIEEFAKNEIALMMKYDRGSQAAMFEDEIEALLLLVDKAADEAATTKPTLDDVQDLISILFADDVKPRDMITLSSVHKAKGREWPTVYLLGRRDYMPFFLAEQDWELEQEDNLIYVAITRAEHNLVYVDGVKKVLDAQTSRLKEGEA